MITTHRLSTALVLLVSGVLLSACNEPTIEEKPIRPAQVWVVADKPIAQTISYTGTVEARHETDLAFRIAGKITSRPVEVGDTVTAGQTIATLDSSDLQLSINNADANIRAAQANAATARSQQAAAQSELNRARAGQTSAQAEQSNARTELQRSQKLFSQGFIGKSTLDTHQTRLDNANAQLQAAKAQVKTAQAQVTTAQAQVATAEAQVKAAKSQGKLSRNQADYSVLKATEAGVITDTFVESGQVVSAGQAIVRIADSNETEAHIHVGEQVVQSLKTGQNVKLTTWTGNNSQPFTGTIREIAPAASANNTWLVKITLVNTPDSLKLGMTVQASLDQTQATDQQWLPPTALYQQDKQAAVWVVDSDNQVALQQVTLQQHLSNGVLVTGLDSGTTVIAAGVNRLHAGQTIQPIPYTGHASPTETIASGAN